MEALAISEVITELHTVRDLLRWAMSQFHAEGIHYGHGTDNAWDEALALVLHSLHLPPNVTPQILEARLTKTERQAVVDLIMQRITQRLPAAYLTNQAWFAGLPFYVDQRVLIPRSSIGELIEKQFVPWVQPEQVTHILDVGTGSGCIAVACALAFPEAHVDAMDISSEALAVAHLNVERHRVQSQVTLYQSDLLTALPATCRYDLIISNPPYVSEAEFAALPAEYYHEPKLGLLGGEDGLAIVERLLQTATDYLKPHGVLIIEVGNSEVLLSERYPQVPFLWLEFEHGEGGVFLLTAAQLQQYAALFGKANK